LHVTAALKVAPGARAQILHREEDPLGIGHSSCLLAQRPSLGAMSSSDGETRDGPVPLPPLHRSAFWSASGIRTKRYVPVCTCALTE
jgi:hypothetical protein